MTAELISVGTELLLGQIVNTNAQFLSQQLAELGISLLHQQVVGDNPARLRETVLQAKQRSDLLVFTGGLGPTADDLTKETVAECYGDPLRFDEEEWQKIEAFFRRLQRPNTPNNRKQAMVPARGRKIPNHHGTAPGCWFEQEGRIAVLMPGVPREMKAMWSESVRPWLLQRQDGVLHSLTLRVRGGESQIETTVAPLLAGENPTAAIYCKTGECEIRITARAGDVEQAERLCRAYAEHFYQLLGPAIYDEDVPGLEYTVVRLLKEKQCAIATAESLTGGTVAQRLTAVPGASEVFGYGFVTYAEQAKTRLIGVPEETIARYGVVSGPVAARMALGAARVSGAGLALGLTGLAGPGGGTLEQPVGTVYVAAACRGRVTVLPLLLGQREREVIRQLAASAALDLARYCLLEWENPDALTAPAQAPDEAFVC